MFIQNARRMKRKGICPEVCCASQSVFSQQIHHYRCMQMALVVMHKRCQDRPLSGSKFERSIPKPNKILFFGFFALFWFWPAKQKLYKSDRDIAIGLVQMRKAQPEVSCLKASGVLNKMNLRSGFANLRVLLFSHRKDAEVQSRVSFFSYEIVLMAIDRTKNAIRVN